MSYLKERRLQPPKENIQHFKTWNFFAVSIFWSFLFYWIRIRIRQCGFRSSRPPSVRIRISTTLITALILNFYLQIRTWWMWAWKTWRWWTQWWPTMMKSLMWFTWESTPHTWRLLATPLPLDFTRCGDFFIFSFSNVAVVTFWYGFGSADPYLWLTDSTPDPAIFVSDLQEDNKKLYFF